MSGTHQPEPLSAADAARLVRKRARKRGLRQYRTIFLVSGYWCIATLSLALIGSLLHVVEVRNSCADILDIDGPVSTQIAMHPPGMVVVCQADTPPPARTVEIPMATTALVILWSALGILASVAFLFSYRHVRKQIDRGQIDL